MVSSTEILGLVYLGWVPLLIMSTIMLNRRKHMHPLDGRFPATITAFNAALSFMYIIQGIDSLGLVPCWLYWWVVSITVVAAYYLGAARGFMVLFKFRIQADLHNYEIIRANNLAYEAHKNATLKRQQSNVRPTLHASAASHTTAGAGAGNGGHHQLLTHMSHHTGHTTTPPLSLESGLRSTESPGVSQVATPTNAAAVGAVSPASNTNGGARTTASIPTLHIVEVKPAGGGLSNEVKVNQPLLTPLPAWTPSFYTRHRKFIRPKGIRTGAYLSIGLMFLACVLISPITDWSSSACKPFALGNIPAWAFWIWFVCLLYCCIFTLSVVQIMRKLGNNDQEGFGLRSEFRMMGYGLLISTLGTFGTAAILKDNSTAVALGLRISLLFGTSIMWVAMTVWPLYLSSWLERQQRLRTIELEKASTDLHSLLELTDGYNAFLSFCQREFCSESLQLYSRVKQFRKDLHQVQSHHGRGSGIHARERVLTSHQSNAGALSALTSPLGSPNGAAITTVPSTPITTMSLPAIKVDISLPGGYLPVPSSMLLPPLLASPGGSPLQSPLGSPLGGMNSGASSPLVSPQPNGSNGTVHLLRAGVSSQRRTPPLSSRSSPHEPSALTLGGSGHHHHHHYHHTHGNRPVITREIVQFWLDEARVIYQQYIAPDAMFQVNLSADMRKNILRAIDRIQTHLRDGRSPDGSPAGVLSPTEGLSPHGENKGLLSPHQHSLLSSNLPSTIGIRDMNNSNNYNTTTTNNSNSANDKRPSASHALHAHHSIGVSTPVHATVVSPSNSPDQHMPVAATATAERTTVTVTAASPPRHHATPQQKYLHRGHQSSSSGGGSAAALALALSQGASSSNTFVAIASTHTSATDMMPANGNTRASITTNASLGGQDGNDSPHSPLSPDQQQQRSPSGILDSIPTLNNNATTPPTPGSPGAAAAADRVAYAMDRKRAVTRTKSSAHVHNAHHMIVSTGNNNGMSVGSMVAPLSGRGPSPTPPKLSPHQRSRSLHNVAGAPSMNNTNTNSAVAAANASLAVGGGVLSSRSHSPMLSISTTGGATTASGMANTAAALAANQITELESLLKDIDAVFVAASDVVFDLMRSNSWRRFLMSDVYAELAAERRGWTGAHTNRGGGGRSRAASRAGASMMHGNLGGVGMGGSMAVPGIPAVGILGSGVVLDDDLVASVVAAAAGHHTNSGNGTHSPVVSVITPLAPQPTISGGGGVPSPAVTAINNVINTAAASSSPSSGQLTDRRQAKTNPPVSGRGHGLASRPSAIK